MKGHLNINREDEGEPATHRVLVVQCATDKKIEEMLEQTGRELAAEFVHLFPAEIAVNGDTMIIALVDNVPKQRVLSIGLKD